MWRRTGIVAVTLWCMAAQGSCADQIDDGRKLAQTHCSRCHVIGDFNRFGGIGSTPSFQLIVNSLPDWQERFETFHVRRPHLSFVRVSGFDYPDPTVFPPNASPVEIRLEDIGAIRAFAQTLKTSGD
jgi:hypothetical protein